MISLLITNFDFSLIFKVSLVQEACARYFAFNMLQFEILVTYYEMNSPLDGFLPMSRYCMVVFQAYPMCHNQLVELPHL